MAFWETLMGGALTAAGGFIAQLWAYWNRQQDMARDDVRRLDERRRAELERVRLLYTRVARLGGQYREATAAEWKAFVQSFVDVKPELDIGGSDRVRAAFHEYLHEIQGIEYEQDQLGYVSEFFDHHDANMDKLTALMRVELREMERHLGASGDWLELARRRAADALPAGKPGGALPAPHVSPALPPGNSRGT